MKMSFSVGNFGHNWEIAKVRVITPYKPYTHEEISATIELHIMLRGINVTLTGAFPNLGLIYS